MRSVEIHYSPCRWVPWTRKVSGTFPENWEDVSYKQILVVAALLKNKSNELAFLKSMAGLKLSVLKRLDNFQLFKLMESVDFISNRVPLHKFIVPKIQIKPGKLILYAPEPKLKGVSFGQFIFADSYFLSYQNTRNPDNLYKFIAALYLPPDEPFSEKNINQRYQQIQKINPNILEAIVLNYQLIHEWLSLAYPLIFQKHEAVSNGKPQSDRLAVESNTWIKVFQNFVGDDIIHDDLWAAKPINTIFSYMTRKYKENARTRNM